MTARESTCRLSWPDEPGWTWDCTCGAGGGEYHDEDSAHADAESHIPVHHWVPAPNHAGRDYCHVHDHLRLTPTQATPDASKQARASKPAPAAAAPDASRDTADGI